MEQMQQNEKPKQKRGKFSSSFGFIMAATGSAVGLGNIWKFPYLAGENGGAVFFIFYIVFVLVLGIPIMLGEMAIGRSTKLSPVGAYEKINKKWKFNGGIGVFCAFIILSYYSVIGGWVLKYIVTYLTNAKITDAQSYFTEFISSPFEPIVWHIIFMVMTCLIVMKGISSGIEKASKIMLPALFVFIILIVIRSVTLEGAMEGIKYFVIPKWSDINSPYKLAKVLLATMGQVFFSLSLGMGAMITYGSYLKKDTDLQKSCFIITGLDALVAVLAGFAILPAVFALGFEPSGGPGLIFVTLPKVFENMPIGSVFGILFFVLVFFAAITSSVSLLEVVTAFCIDNLKMKRKSAALITSLIMTFIGVFAAASYGPLSSITIFGLSIFDAMTFFTDKLLMPIGAFLMSIFVGHIWGVENAASEITNGGTISFKLKKVFAILIKYVAPAFIAIIFFSSLLPI